MGEGKAMTTNDWCVSNQQDPIMALRGLNTLGSLSAILDGFFKKSVH